jgi:hypothetical protein
LSGCEEIIQNWWVTEFIAFADKITRVNYPKKNSIYDGENDNQNADGNCKLELFTVSSILFDQSLSNSSQLNAISQVSQPRKGKFVKSASQELTPLSPVKYAKTNKYYNRRRVFARER